MKNSNIGMVVHNTPSSPPDIAQIEIDEIVETLTSEWIIARPKTKELEHLIVEKSGTDRAVCLNSNMTCVEMILRVLGTGSGDEVTASVRTYAASVSVVNYVGAKIVLVNCEKGKFTIDYERLEAAISFRTKVVIPVDTFDISVDYDRTLETVDRKKYLFNLPDNRIQQAIGRVIIMLDGTHRFGVVYKGKPVTQYPDFVNHSQCAVKNFATAEGGVITWRSIPDIDNSDLYHQYMLLNLHEQNKDAFVKAKLNVWEYDIVGP